MLGSHVLSVTVTNNPSISWRTVYWWRKPRYRKKTMHRPAANHRKTWKIVNITTIQWLTLWSLT